MSTFETLTDAKWANQLRAARAQTNLVSEQIKMKLHPQNTTPGLEPVKQPVDIREVLELMELILSGLKETRTSYYFSGAADRLKQLKKRL